MAQADSRALMVDEDTHSCCPINTERRAAALRLSSLVREARGQRPHRFYIGWEGGLVPPGGDDDIGEADTALVSRSRLAFVCDRLLFYLAEEVIHRNFAVDYAVVLAFTEAECGDKGMDEGFSVACDIVEERHSLS